MDIPRIIELCCTVISIIGVTLVCIPKIQGVYLIILAQTGWVIFSALKDLDFLLIQSLYMVGINIYAIWSWGKKNVG